MPKLSVFLMRFCTRDDNVNGLLRKVLKPLHYPLEIMLVCVRWYVAYPLSLRNLEEMMAERGIAVDHATVHRWGMKLLPVLENAFRRCKRPVGKSWRVDETYIKVKGQWTDLYRVVDKAGNTVDFLLRTRRDKEAARRYFEKAIYQNGVPETVPLLIVDDFALKPLRAPHDEDFHDLVAARYERAATRPRKQRYLSWRM
ncbi:transposase-like protein [Paraburkholderia sp. WSM4179]|nr:transposase-like protein [Paraburkholderia sp. WSM4179]